MPARATEKQKEMQAANIRRRVSIRQYMKNGEGRIARRPWRRRIRLPPAGYIDLLHMCVHPSLPLCVGFGCWKRLSPSLAASPPLPQSGRLRLYWLLPTPRALLLPSSLVSCATTDFFTIFLCVSPWPFRVGHGFTMRLCAQGDRTPVLPSPFHHVGHPFPGHALPAGLRICFGAHPASSTFASVTFLSRPCSPSPPLLPAAGSPCMSSAATSTELGCDRCWDTVRDPVHRPPLS